jgi:hypothetical protein
MSHQNQNKTGASRLSNEAPQPSQVMGPNVQGPSAKERTDMARTVQKAEEEAAEGETGYIVVQGKSVAAGRGIIEGGKPIGPLDVVRYIQDRQRGVQRLNELVEKGLVARTGKGAVAKTAAG